MVMNERDPSDEELESMVQRAQAIARQARTIILVVAGLALVAWLLSGIYIVQPGEQGVVQLFGQHIGTTGPGINYRLPAPIQSHAVVDMQSIRRMEVGFRSDAPPEAQRVLEEALMLTRDENIVEVGLLVQYRVSDAAAYTFNVQNPEDVLRTSIEVSLRGAVGQMPIDAVITEQRAEVQEITRTYLEAQLAKYNPGLLVTDVRLQVADAPDQVRDAFHEVVRAREDRERIINEAQAYREDIVPRARGDAQEILQQALAYKEERVRAARGESDRFIAVLNEYRSAPEVTRERMYIEAMERVLGKVDKVLLSDNQSGVLPFLPLRNTPAAAPVEATSPPPAPQPAPQASPNQTAPVQPAPAQTTPPTQQSQQPLGGTP